MDKFFFGGFLIGLVMFFLATLGGTFLFWIWPVFAPLFHLPELGWWQAVCLTWATHILIPTNRTSSGHN